VPNFGADSDVETTLKHASAAESKYGHWDVLAKPADPPPMDYFVPNYGEDKEITGTKNSVAEVEKKFGHFWNPSTAPPAEHPVDYFVPN